MIDNLNDSILQEMYDSEINFSISCFWDSGFTVKLGDDYNWYKAETVVYGWNNAKDWLHNKVLLHYPDSDYSIARSVK